MSPARHRLRKGKRLYEIRPRADYRREHFDALRKVRSPSKPAVGARNAQGCAGAAKHRDVRERPCARTRCAPNDFNRFVRKRTPAARTRRAFPVFVGCAAAHQSYDNLPISQAYPVTDPDHRKRMRLWDRACPRIGTSESSALRAEHTKFMTTSQRGMHIQSSIPMIETEYARGRFIVRAGLPANRPPEIPRRQMAPWSTRARQGSLTRNRAASTGLQVNSPYRP